MGDRFLAILFGVFLADLEVIVFDFLDDLLLLAKGGMDAAILLLDDLGFDDGVVSAFEELDVRGLHGLLQCG